jgi:hypothetical protein
MADDAKTLIQKLRRLGDVEEALTTEYREKMDAIRGERTALLGGGPGIGAVLKRLEASYDVAWCVRYAPGAKNQYSWNYKEDRPHWKRLLKRLSTEELEVRIVRYLMNADQFYVKERHPFSLFVRNVNAFVGEGRDAAEMELSAGLELCIREGQHAPPCKSDQEHTRKKMLDMRS